MEQVRLLYIRLPILDNLFFQMAHVNEPAIGIDLGTTLCCVGVFRFGKVEIIANNFGFRTTPSVVSFDEYSCLTGDAAKHQQYDNIQNRKLLYLRFLYGHLHQLRIAYSCQLFV